MPSLTMPERIDRAIKKTADVPAADAHTCEPPLTMKECVGMATDCYLEMYGDDNEAVTAYRALPVKEQAKIERRLKKTYG